MNQQGISSGVWRWDHVKECLLVSQTDGQGGRRRIISACVCVFVSNSWLASVPATLIAKFGCGRDQSPYTGLPVGPEKLAKSFTY